MANQSTQTELERVYTIPLRKTKDLVRSRRADLAVRDVKRFLSRHMKSDDIWLDNEVNQALWARGKYTIPSRIRVRATRFSDGVVEVTLPEAEHTGSVRSELAERREKAAETPVLKAPEAPMADDDGHVHSEHDQPVTVLEGVGPATAEKLEKAGIHGIEDLAKAEAAELAKEASVPAEKAEAWIAEAKKLVAAAPKAEAKADAKADEAEAKPAKKAAKAKAPKADAGEEE